MNAFGNILLGFVTFVLVLCCVIVVHELGHFIVAKISGIRVDEFSFGFGPKLYSHKKGETQYSIRAIPAGGFVKMPGMLGLEGEADAGERNFYRAAGWKRALTLLAGILSNFIFAGILFSIVAMSTAPSYVVNPGPLSSAGFVNGDAVVAVNGINVPSSGKNLIAQRLHDATVASNGHAISITMLRSNGTRLTKVVHPLLVLLCNSNVTAKQGVTSQVDYVIQSVNGSQVQEGNPEAVLGNGGTVKLTVIAEGASGPRVEVTVHGVIDTPANGSAKSGTITAAWRVGYSPPQPGYAFPQAVVMGFGAVPNYLGSTLSQLGTLIRTNPGGLNGNAGLSGPVGIAVVGEQQAKAGFINVIGFIAEISASVGLLNVFPIPFLDGGRFLFLVIELIRRKRMNPEHEAMIYTAGLIFLLFLAIYVTVGDVNKIPFYLKGG